MKILNCKGELVIFQLLLERKNTLNNVFCVYYKNITTITFVTLDKEKRRLKIRRFLYVSKL